MGMTEFHAPDNELMAALARAEDGTGALEDLPAGDAPQDPVPPEQQAPRQVPPQFQAPPSQRQNGNGVFTPPSQPAPPTQTPPVPQSSTPGDWGTYLRNVQNDQIEMSHQVAHIANDAAATRRALLIMCAGMGAVALLLLIYAYKQRGLVEYVAD